MSADVLPTDILPELLAELEAAAAQAGRGIPDPEAARKAAADVDRVREAIRRKHGVLDIGGPTIRELRDAWGNCSTAGWRSSAWPPRSIRTGPARDRRPSGVP